MSGLIPDPALQLDLYRRMLTIRRFEERCNYLFMQGKIPSTLHLYIGQEAVAVGVCAHLTDADYATSTHRPHGHSLAKGVTPRAIMAELYAKRTGCCKGKGGSMHVGDMTVGMIPAIAIVGGNIPLTTGLALACKRLGQGPGRRLLHGRWRDERRRVPRRAQHGRHLATARPVRRREQPLRRLHAGVVDVQDREHRGPRRGYGMRGEIVDGMDVLAVYEAAGRAIEQARRGEGPTLLECKTYRLCGHSRSDPRTYRSKEEEAEWATRDPILRLGASLKEAGHATDESLAEIEQRGDRGHRRRGCLRRSPARRPSPRKRWKTSFSAKARSHSSQYGGLR